MPSNSLLDASTYVPPTLMSPSKITVNNAQSQFSTKCIYIQAVHWKMSNLLEVSALTPTQEKKESLFLSTLQLPV